MSTVEFIEDELYEVVDGVRLDKPAMGVYQALVASTLFGYLWEFTRTHRLGRPVLEALFALDMLGRRRRPDAAYVSYERCPAGQSPTAGEAWDVVPDLAIEVVSPTNSFDHVEEKLLEYFQAGVKQVWVVSTQSRRIYVYDSPTQVQILTEKDEITGGTLLPGFRLKIATIFEQA